ncbi:P-loop containing dynein motor region D4 protein, partial [Helicosporidium sp. ATCC 50920]
MQVFGVSLTKTYNVGSFLEDLRALVRALVLQQKPVCFLLAESDIRDEAFFEYLNQLLVTGEIPGLFPRDEMEQILGDLQPIMQAARPGVPDSWRARHQFFVESVRRHLHLVLCLSSAGTRLARVQQHFPGLVAGCTIDWYLPWPDDALTSVADFLLRDADLRADEQGRARVCRLLARAQLCAVQAAHRYRAETRRSVHITPAHFFSFVDSFRSLYVSKLEGKVRLAGTLRSGLQKMSDAKEDVAAMAKTLKLTSLDLEKAAKEVETLLQEITRSTALAEKEKHKVAVIVSSVTSKASGSEHIAMVKQDAERDLQEARPALESAVAALNSITPKDINSLKSLKNPPNIVKRIFDCVLLLRHFPLNPVVWEEFKNQKVLKGSYEEAVKMMGDLTFMQALVNFPKEGINDETVELIQPYFEAPDFNYESAKKASGNVAGLCNWADAMCKYHAVAKMVEPKIAALRQAEIEFRGATRERLQAESEFKVVQGRLDDMQREFESVLSQKQTLERDLNAAQARL